MSATPDDILDRLTRLYPKAIEPGLARTLRVLQDLDNPHLNMPPAVHIAGTNGKGSTLAFIRAMAEDAGLKVHAMTSPHLVRFNERLVVSSREITDEALLSLLHEVEDRNAGKPITFFEITTAAGFLEFARNPAHLCLIETGMGGRLDSTNVIEKPAVTIITNISMDHMQHLGDTLLKIAYEKACIMKRGVPCIIGPQTEESLKAGVMGVFEDYAKEIGAPLFRHGHEWSFKENAHGFTLNFQNRKYDLPRPSLLGAHQVANAATAVAAVLATPELSSLRKQGSAFFGLTKAKWPARLQKIESGALFDLLPPGWDLVLDGGHNEAGGKILADQARAWTAQDGKPLHLVLGMLTTKDPAPFYDHLKPHIASATAITIPGEKLTFTAGDLAAKLAIPSAGDVSAALRQIVQSQPPSHPPSHPPGRILITGSLYLAGHILKL